MTEGKCILRFQRISPKKVKPVLDLVRGKTVQEALWTLAFISKKKAAGLIEKAIKAARASYREKAGPDARPDDEIFISLAKVDRGPIYKRFRAAWRGRAVMIRRRFSHITIEVKERR
jgi:large subunit ribosomal protein L22